MRSLLLLLVCVSWTITGQPRNSVFIRSVAEISCHLVLSGDRIRQCEISSGSRHKSQFPSAGTVHECAVTRLYSLECTFGTNRPGYLLCAAEAIMFSLPPVSFSCYPELPCQQGGRVHYTHAAAEASYHLERSSAIYWNLWNQLPDSFRQPSQSRLDSPPYSLVSSSPSSPLSSSITPWLFHSRLKTYLFNKSFPSYTYSTLDCLRDHRTVPDLSCFSIYI